MHRQTPKGGDAVARAKLTAVVKLREQLGSRASTEGALQGLSVRPPAEAARPGMDRWPPRLIRSTWAVPRPMSSTGWTLASLDDASLIDAASSAAGLGDDARTARFAAELVRRGSQSARAIDLRPLVSALVRQAIGRGDADDALKWIERRDRWPTRRPPPRSTSGALRSWRCTIGATPCLEIYQSLIGHDRSGAAMALDGALTMIDNGHFDLAGPALYRSAEPGAKAGLFWIEQRASRLLADPGAGLA